MQTWQTDLRTQQGKERLGLIEREALIHTLVLLLSHFSRVRLCATP